MSCYGALFITLGVDTCKVRARVSVKILITCGINAMESDEFTVNISEC